MGELLAPKGMKQQGEKVSSMETPGSAFELRTSRRTVVTPGGGAVSEATLQSWVFALVSC